VDGDALATPPPDPETLLTVPREKEFETWQLESPMIPPAQEDEADTGAMLKTREMVELL
jgi:hypothetical protein